MLVEGDDFIETVEEQGVLISVLIELLKGCNPAVQHTEQKYLSMGTVQCCRVGVERYQQAERVSRRRHLLRRNIPSRKPDTTRPRHFPRREKTSLAEEFTEGAVCFSCRISPLQSYDSEALVPVSI